MAKKTFFQSFLAVGIIVTGIYILLHFVSVPKKRERMPDAISQEETDQIYHLLSLWDMVTQKNHIPYWIDGVTLLGAIRQQGIIQKESEIYIFLEDKSRVAALENLFATFGVQLLSHARGFTLSIKDIHIDVFLAAQENKSIISQDGTRFWEEENLLPLTRIPFGPLYLNAPNQPMPRLISLFGKKCTLP